MDLPHYTPIDILISSVLAFIMFGVGLSLTSTSFKNVIFYPKALVAGLSSQIIVLPIISFTITYFSNLPLPFKVGLIILSSCPGGTVSGFLTYFFKGNAALSITFTSINSFITLITIPFIVNLSLVFYYGKTTEIHLSYIETIIQIFSVTIIPALIGVFVRSRYPAFAIKTQRPLKMALLVALGVVFLVKFFATEQSGGTGITMKEVITILPFALLLNGSSMFWGYRFGKAINLGIRNSYTIGIEAAVQNTTLAFLVAGTLLGNQEMVKPSLIYAMFSFWTAIIYTFLIKRSNGLKLFDEFNS
jgi:bile acid:Na+ symporter, BASS family